MQCHYIVTDAFILSIVWKDIIKDLENLEDVFDFNKLDKKHELLSDKIKKVIGKLKTETPKSFWIDEFVCLGSKMYSFKCGDDIKIKLKKIFYISINAY